MIAHFLDADKSMEEMQEAYTLSPIPFITASSKEIQDILESYQYQVLRRVYKSGIIAFVKTLSVRNTL
jgi:hypothetical protein